MNIKRFLPFILLPKEKTSMREEIIAYMRTRDNTLRFLPIRNMLELERERNEYGEKEVITMKNKLALVTKLLWPSVKRGLKVLVGAFLAGGLLAVADQLGAVVPADVLGLPLLAWATAGVLFLEKLSEKVFGSNL